MSVGETIRAWAARLEQAALAIRERNVLRTELAELAAKGELDRALADAGLTRSQVGTLIDNHPHACQLLGQMIERLGVDPVRLEAVESMREVSWRCTTCTEKQRCADWLADGRGEGWYAFCPNAASFSAAKREAH
jgi:hypothetical protein